MGVLSSLAIDRLAATANTLPVGVLSDPSLDVFAQLGVTHDIWSLVL
jgi:hypothetical protein